MHHHDFLLPALLLQMIFPRDIEAEDNETFYLGDIEVIAKPDTVEYITQETNFHKGSR